MKENLINSLKEFMSKVNKKKVVLGLSGGIDSAVILALAVKALGKENVTAIFMPEIRLTSKTNYEDTQILSKQFGVKLLTIPINPFIIAKNFSWNKTNIAEMNFKPRIRMTVLYDYANSNDAIVLGTSNKSEIYLGYGTKYGDCASDVMPIGDLFKTEVFELSAELGIPQQIINKKPSAELIKDQFDEDELGIDYQTADKIIKIILKGELTKQQMELKFGEKKVNLVLKRIKDNEHKRTPIPILKK